MEFIPLETHGGKKVKKGGKKTSPAKGQKDSETLKSKTNKDVMVKKGKSKLQNKMLEKKKVKNKYREVLTKKRKRSSKKDTLTRGNDEDEDDDEEEEEELKKIETASEAEEEGDEDNEEEEEEGDESDVESEEEEDDDEEAVIQKKQEKAIKEKWKKMDDKMKNRLFVKMKKKIVNEAQVKELHPDIRGVIFPRKKNVRWCWAVFASQEKALAALKKLSKNQEILVSKPNPRDRVEKKREDKYKSVQRRKENRKKLQQMWT